MKGKLEIAIKEIAQVVKGKDEIIEKVIAAILAGGHVLLEDIPGVGKTTLAMSIAKTLSMDYNRVQFTPDVLPSDIMGFSMYNAKTGEFEYREGSAFCNLFLADEINRTSPKTQSALLEIMEEKHVTVDAVTRELPEPFAVIATENPLGSSGTQMLPESQLDRFMVCLSMGYPSHESAIEILKGQEFKPISHVKAVLTREDLLGLQEKANSLEVHESIFDYIVSLTEATRESEYFSLGASPRGSIALLRMSRAVAVLRGREYVTPEDIGFIYTDVLAHRVRLGTKAKANGLDTKAALTEVRKSVKLPRT
ncbi:MAG: MoxR family ATPase [Lachnospiraceae bacterium]|nr:MoxR family ATPase [Lachnospiraceae bacterium]